MFPEAKPRETVRSRGKKLTDVEGEKTAKK